MSEPPNRRWHEHAHKQCGGSPKAALRSGSGDRALRDLLDSKDSASERVAAERGVHGPGRARCDLPAYAELRSLSNFSFLCGASHPEELVARAVELGYAALALTDRNSLAGVVRAHLAAKEHGLHLIIGAEVTPHDAPPIVLLAPDRAAYGRLCRLITRGRTRGIKGSCALDLSDIADHAEGLIGVVAYELGDAISREPRDEETKGRTRDPSGRRFANRNPQSEIRNPQFIEALHEYRRHFGDRLYLGADLAYDWPDGVRLTAFARLSEATGIPLIATNPVHYHVPERRYLQDVLTCIREKCTLTDAGRRLLPNAERHLRPRDEIAQRYRGYEPLLRRTIEVARSCTFSLDELRYEYPRELVPDDRTASGFLAELTWTGAARAFRERAPANAAVSSSAPLAPAAWIPADIRALIESELRLIAELKYEHYFLTVWDLCRFARQRGILCQGRGSAANSAVCYYLGVTAVDPTRVELLFERFISKERNEPPDIDVDFEHVRREEVFQYIYEKYGRERAGIAAEVIRYRPRSAVRDVGKALGLSLDRVDKLAKSIDWWAEDAALESGVRECGLDPRDRTVQMLMRLVRQLVGFPRHLSQHVGGFVITDTPLCEIVPIENGGMPGRTFIEWDKDDIDALGILKVDCLALGMLTALRMCFTLLHETSGSGEQGATAARCACHCVPGRSSPARADCRYVDPTAQRLPDGPSSPVSGSPLPVPSNLRSIPSEDPAVYDMLCAADTVGVFQIESRAQMSMLPRLKPRSFYDLVIEVAIVRPGPIQGGMVHPYLRRRDGLEAVSYPSPAVRSVLEKTLGVPLFQEQVMRLAVVAAGFTPGEADQLRRAMAAWRRNGSIEKFHFKLIDGMLTNGYAREFAEQVYKQICGFGEYGFPESHAASFALLVYASAWLKRYHPAAFCAAVINSQPMGFYTPGQLIRDAIAHGVRVLPVDVNYSDWDCTLEEGTKGRGDVGTKAAAGAQGPALRLGLRLVRGLNEEKVRGLLVYRRARLECARSERARCAAPAPSSRPSGPDSPPDCRRESGAAPCLSECRVDGGATAPGSPFPVSIGGQDVRPTSCCSSSLRPAVPARPPITSIPALARRAGVTRDTLARLAGADAFRSLALDRRQALWQILALDDGDHPLLAEIEPPSAAAPLPAEPLDETVVEDYDAVGFSLSAHPLQLVRRELAPLGVLRSDALATTPHGRRVAVAGLVTCRQRPGTAKGIVFMTLEDEAGMANLIIRPNVWERYAGVGRSRLALIADGVIERQSAVVHLMVQRLTDLSKRLGTLRPASRDFH
ncbi:MAG: DNA polymerase III subunit alpha [Phycisphaerae bacterium]